MDRSTEEQMEVLIISVNLLEKRVATLEGQAQEQPSTEDFKHVVFYYLNMAQYLINVALSLIVTKEELFTNEPTSQSISNSNSNI